MQWSHHNDTHPLDKSSAQCQPLVTVIQAETTLPVIQAATYVTDHPGSTCKPLVQVIQAASTTYTGHPATANNLYLVPVVQAVSTTCTVQVVMAVPNCQPPVLHMRGVRKQYDALFCSM